MIKKFLKFYRNYFWSSEKRARFHGAKIGSNCNIQDVSFGSESYLIEIGNHVQITSGTKLFTHGAAWVLREKYPKIDFFGKIKIGDNVYIGNDSLIMPGVTINSNVIVAAGSIVTKSIPEGMIVGGNPARIIGSLESFEKKMSKYNLESKGMGTKKKNYLLSLGEEKFIMRGMMSKSNLDNKILQENKNEEIKKNNT